MTRRRAEISGLAERDLRASIRIATLASTWDCDVSQIRRLIDAGELETHGIGRAVRVYIDSANDYQARGSRSPKAANLQGCRPRPGQRPVDKAAQREAVATLRRQGIV